MDRLFLNQLKIKRFRSLSNININFDYEKNEIIGRNGTGKSSILDAIRFMLTNKDENGNRLYNLSTITSSINTDDDLRPSIELVINFQSKNISLKTHQGKWYINDIPQQSLESYFKTLYDKLGTNQDALVFAINPNLLKNSLASNTGRENKDIAGVKKQIVGIVNSLSKNNTKIISQEKFDTLINEIEGLNKDIKDIKSSIKHEEENIKHLKEINSEISNWKNTNYEVNSLDQKEFELSEKKQKLEKIKKDIYLKSSKLEDLLTEKKSKKSELLKLENSDSGQKTSPSTIEIVVCVLLFLFAIIPAILYLLLYLLPKYKNSNNDQSVSIKLKDLKTEIKNLEREIEEIEKDLNNLKNDPLYQNAKLEDIIQELSKINENKNLNDSNKTAKIKYLQYLKNIKNLENEQNRMQEELIEKQNKKREIVARTNETIKQFFPDFDISLFNEKDQETLIITKNNIPLNYLNHSQKMNLIFQINNFLNKKLGFDCFTLIDGGESFNKINYPNQVVIAKVNNESDLKINGQNIY